MADLEWSEDLYQICLIRGKQIAKEFSHKQYRPTCEKYYKTKYGLDELFIEIDNTSEYGDGTFETYSIIGGENIAIGQSSYKQVCESWKKSNGHYHNMINKGYVTGAISCYRVNNTTLWVAAFGTITDAEFNRVMADPNRVVDK